MSIQLLSNWLEDVAKLFPSDHKKGAKTSLSFQQTVVELLNTWTITLKISYNLNTSELASFTSTVISIKSQQHHWMTDYVRSVRSLRSVRSGWYVCYIAASCCFSPMAGYRSTHVNIATYWGVPSWANRGTAKEYVANDDHKEEGGCIAGRKRGLPETEWLARLEAWVAGRLGLPGNL